MPTEAKDGRTPDNDVSFASGDTSSGSILQTSNLVNASLHVSDAQPHSKRSATFTLYCDQERINSPIDVKYYAINLKQCVVKIETKGCIHSDHYTYNIPLKMGYRSYDKTEGVVRTFNTHTVGGVNINLSWRDRASILFKGKFSKDTRHKDDEQVSYKGKAPIPLITFFGNYWKVGDDRNGDWNNQPNGWLRGPYFNQGKQ